MSIRLSFSVLALTALATGCAGMGMGMGSAPAKTADGALVGSNGMTLYTFDRDASGSGKSVCNGPCATNWPPLMAGASDSASGDWSVITRDDGSKQWAYRGKPLYYWAKDQKAGDRTGDGFNNVWHVAKP
jgi:predicted lipoprotein with Yx(FWY)xxD motif